MTNDTTPDAGIVEAARDYLGSSEGGEAAAAGALSWLAGVLREEAADRWAFSHLNLATSVADPNPDPSDPYVFGPP
jgi:hypothetical protein